MKEEEEQVGTSGQREWKKMRLPYNTYVFIPHIATSVRSSLFPNESKGAAFWWRVMVVRVKVCVGAPKLPLCRASPVWAERRRSGPGSCSVLLRQPVLHWLNTLGLAHLGACMEPIGAGSVWKVGSFGSSLPWHKPLVSERARGICNGERWSAGDLETWGKVETHGFEWLLAF